jgi:hypothetical protein
MNAERLNDIYRNIHIAEKSDIDNIRQLTVDYPFYHLPYVVLAKYYYDTSHYKFEDMLRQAAMRVKDRKELYQYIHGRQEEKEIQARVEDFLSEQVITDPAGEIEISLKPEDAVIDLMPEAERIEPEEPEIVYQAEPELPSEIEEPQVIEYVHPEIPEQHAVELETNALTPEESIQEQEAMPPTIAEKAGIAEFLQEFDDEQDGLPSEFVFEGKHEAVDLQDIEIDRDLIGEEIATEFSFSRSFTAEPELVQEEVGTTEPELAENPEIREEEEEEIQEEETEVTQEVTEPEETFVGHEHHTAQDLRKNPVYSIDALVPEVQATTEEDLSPEKDFFAWLQHPKYISQDKPAEAEAIIEEPTDKKFDLIDRFININPQISRPKKEFFSAENMAKRSEVLDLEYVTETLAAIYKEQGNLDLAISSYEKLSLQNPSKQAYFASLIENIKKEKK